MTNEEMLKVSEAELRKVLELEAAVPAGKWRYWPTHYAGSIPSVTDEDVTRTYLQVPKHLENHHGVEVCQFIAVTRNLIRPLIEEVLRQRPIVKAAVEARNALGEAWNKGTDDPLLALYRALNEEVQ